MSIAQVNIAGVDVSSVFMEDLVAIFNETITLDKKMRVCVTPVNCITAAAKSDELKQLYNTADIVLCDGIPLKWAASFLGTPIKERITGLDLVPQYIAECNRRGYSMFFLGAKEGVAASLVQKIRSEFPNPKIAGYYSPPFANKFSVEENKKILALINEVKPNVLFVSLTAPKQDYWIAEHFDAIESNILIGVGGAFEVTAGLVPRAPVWMQKNGLEWLFRFLQEPRRLFRRYFIEAPVFFPLIIKQKLNKR